jgi:hypothetical protein
MRTWVLWLGLAALVGGFGCGNDGTEVIAPQDLEPPLGLQSITGDGMVTLFWWCSNYDDLVGYKVYMHAGPVVSDDPREDVPAGFAAVDSIEVDPPCSTQKSVDITGLANGTTYAFLVVAVRNSDWNEISHTSNIVSDTPRAETAGTLRIYAKQVDAEQAAIDLGDFDIADCSDINGAYNTPDGTGDVMAERFDPGAGQRLWLDGINDGWIQDLGYMSDWDLADQAPTQSYADAGHSVEALLGHVYAVWTGTNHFGKVQVTDFDVDDGWVELKAAYQPKLGEPEYK